MHVQALAEGAGPEHPVPRPPPHLRERAPHVGANLISVQKLLGHSDPKITERRYGHLLPEFMKSEVDRLRFGLDRLAPRLDASGAPPATAGSDSPDFASDRRRLGTPVVRNGADVERHPHSRGGGR